jgi:hypothetical protein
MSRRHNRMQHRKPRKEPTEEVRKPEDRTDGSSAPPSRKTLLIGLPMVGSEILEAIGSNGTVGRAMHDVIYTPDDEKMNIRLGPEQEAAVAFHPDLALGDAGAEFAEEFGRDFLVAATTGEDIGEIESAAGTESSEVGGPFLQEVMLDDDFEDLTEDAGLLEPSPSTTARRRLPEDDEGSAGSRTQR